MALVSTPTPVPDPTESSGVTLCLNEMQRGVAGSEERLLQLVYQQLRRIAGQKMRRERIDHTLQPTALANEVYLKLKRTIRETDWRDRAHFYNTCSRMMRNILVDHARHRQPERDDVAFVPELALTVQRSEELLALDRSLDRLAKFDPRGAQTIELTQILGLRQEEVAASLNTSVRTVKRDIRSCLKWLRADMGGLELREIDPEDVEPKV